MTENELRNSIVAEGRKYLGLVVGDERHLDILNTYNSLVPLPRGYKVQTYDDWCATYVTAMFIKCGMVDLIGGGECGCGEQVKIARNMGIYKGRDYVPKTGDLVMYDYKPDGWSDHTGIVIACDGVNLRTVEGNVNRTCVEKMGALNDKGIIGFIAPNFASKATSEPVKQTIMKGVVKTALNVRTSPAVDNNLVSPYRILNAGDIVEVLKISDGWLYVRANDRKYGIYDAWCNGTYVAVYEEEVEDFMPAPRPEEVVPAPEKKEIKVGDRVRFVGDALHISSYANSKGVPKSAFTGYVKAIYSHSRSYPYYVVADGNVTDGYCKEEDLELI